MNNSWRKGIHFVIGCFFITLFNQTVSAEVKTGTFNISATVRAPTCSFSEANKVVTLDDVNEMDFNDSSIHGEKEVKVALSCQYALFGNVVNLIPEGIADSVDSSAFQNTGTAKNIALRLQDKDSNIVTPDKTTSIPVTVTNNEGSYTFKLGYVATTPGEVIGGTFTSTVILSLKYE
ncbi:fimbrial protein [Enterobacter wuhouensis]|uniref:fimbrial protein n=1 Tax=Enterobacter wuhouensis TaxID=2529381 RepID=UPI003D76A863